MLRSWVDDCFIHNWTSPDNIATTSNGSSHNQIALGRRHAYKFNEQVKLALANSQWRSARVRF